MTELLLPSEPPPAPVAIEDALGRFEPVPPALLASRGLLQRVDRKFALPVHAVGAVAEGLRGTHGLLRAGRALVARYRTIYFDTHDLQFYDAHRRGRPERYKVRIRHHIDREKSFVEVKHRTVLGHSTKSILPRPFGAAVLDEEAQAFIERHCPVSPRDLQPRMWIAFRRITLVGCDVDERLTLDCDLEYGDGCRSERWPAVAIAEIKQAHRSNHSPSSLALRRVHAVECSISKYCVATARLSAVRGNAFKPAILALERVSRQDTHGSSD